MKHLLFILLMTGVCLSAFSQDVDLKTAFRQLNETIAHGQNYVDDKEQKISSMKELCAKANNDEQAYIYTTLVGEEYQAYDNDSALTYMKKSLVLAQKLQQQELVNEVLISIAHQYAVSGYYDEANSYVNRVDKGSLHGKNLERYFSTMTHLFGEMGFYSKDEEQKSVYRSKAAVYNDSLMTVVIPNTSLYYQKKQAVFLANKDFEKAKEYSDLWLNITPENSKDYPTMAYYRAELFGKMGNHDEQKHWLIRSAIKDIENTRMNQASLWSLASLLHEEGEIRLSHQYIKYSWQCISRFSTHMRGWQVVPIMESIDNDYQLLLDNEKRFFYGGLILVSVLSIALLITVKSLRKRNRQLTGAHRKQDELNKELVAFNEKLTSANLQLADSNRVKEKYIGAFLSLCIQYIEKLDNFRIKVNRKLKVGQVSEVVALTDSDKLKKEELDKLHKFFDDTFLTLFPTFIDDFNQLLQPDSRIDYADKSSLNTELRIFALVRLGIDDSASIAQFLHYSPNSIYCYRARTKNKALGCREDFEAHVKVIGQGGN